MVVDRRQFKPAEWRALVPKPLPVSRQKLIPLEGSDATYTATYRKYYEVPGGFTTIMFVDVCIEGERVADHVWMKENYFWRGMKLQPGERIQFIARCGRYVKGAGDKRCTDFCLYYPRDVHRV